MRRLALALFASIFVLAAFVPSGARAATGAALPAPRMTCSFPDDPTGGEFCEVVMTVAGAVCRNHCLAAAASPATVTTATRAGHLSRLYAIN